MPERVPADPLWLSVARMSLSVREVPGPGSNPTILQWAKDIGAPDWYADDDSPWCAVFLNRLFMACQMPMAGAGFDLLRAKSFETWGVPLTMPAFGCVMTFRRPEGSHVGLYLGEKDDAYFILGGNQSNAVSQTWIAKSRLSSTRWPLMQSVTLGRIWLDVHGTLSVNEQ
jgi:uncharacterized protein (TIGR02594 family)